MPRLYLQWSIILATLLFLIGPFFIIIAASLSNGESMAFPPDGLSLRWYVKIFNVESFRQSFGLSMFLAIFGTLFALLLGVLVGTYSSLFIATPVMFDATKKDK